MEVAHAEESGDEEALPVPALDNLNMLAEEFSAQSLCFPTKRARVIQLCLKDDVRIGTVILD